MERKVLEALLNLRIALGELQASLDDIDKAIRDLMTVELEVQERHFEQAGPGETATVS